MSRNSKYRNRIEDNQDRARALAEFSAELIAAGQFPAIVFVRTRRHAAVMAEAMARATQIDVPCVTSLLSKQSREELAERMRRRDPSMPVVVATSVWSTGLDVPTLSWVMIAGCGKAPVGLKQSGGRATRPSESKDGYTIYDVWDMGPGAEWARAQSLTRAKHYADAGFSLCMARPTKCETLDDDARRLRALLSAPPVQPTATAAAPAVAERGPEAVPSSSPRRKRTLDSAMDGLLAYAFSAVGIIAVIALLHAALTKCN